MCLKSQARPKIISAYVEEIAGWIKFPPKRTPSKSNGARTVGNHVAGNVPRLGLLVIHASVSSLRTRGVMGRG